MVYVLHKNGNPLMPTVKHGYVRFLLKHNKATVVSAEPFVIRLNYETGDVTQPLYACLDIGRTNIGVAVVDGSANVSFVAEVVTRNREIPKLMQERKAHRVKHRQTKVRAKKKRRAKKNGTTVQGGEIKRYLPQEAVAVTMQLIRNKPARFCNRKRPEGWLTPTANQLLLTHINIVKKTQQFLPISGVAFEGNRFAFMQMDDNTVSGIRFCEGPLKGYGSVEEAVYDIQDGKCYMCGCDRIDHYHHVIPRHEHGSDTIANRAGLCSKCHDKVHTDPQAKAELKKMHEGKNKKYDALGILNQITPYLLREFSTMFPGSVYVVRSKTTAAKRDLYKLEKEHHIDACCVGFAVVGADDTVKIPDKVHLIRQFRRHDRRRCHQEMLDRKYLLDGKVVATNRHRAIEQKTPALDEYVAAGGRTELLAVKEHHATYRSKDRVMPGSTLIADGKPRVLQGSEGRHNGQPDYYIFTDGNKTRTKKCVKILENKGLVFCGNLH